MTTPCMSLAALLSTLQHPPLAALYVMGLSSIPTLRTEQSVVSGLWQVLQRT